MANVKEMSVEEKLRALYDLQLIDSRIDEIRNVRGELPLEVEDLEDEVNADQSTIRRYAIEAAKQVGGWNSSSGYPLEISRLNSTDGKRYAATRRGGGGAGRGWMFKEIAANFKPCIEPSSSTGQNS